MIEIGVLGVFAGVSVTITLFLSYYLISLLRPKNPSLVWMGLVLLAVGLRVAKSIVFFIMYGIWPIGLSIGFFALASIGPLYWTYINKVHDKGFDTSGSWYFHFVIPVLGAIACYLVTPSVWETIFYQSATALLSLYLLASHRKHLKYTYENEEEKKWLTQTLLLMWGIWLAFVYQHVAGEMLHYAYGAILAALFIFYIFGTVMRKPPIFSRSRKAEVGSEVLEKIRESFEVDHVYRSAGVSVNTLAHQLEVPAYQVTKAVKELYNKTFPEALSHFRVVAFKGMIADPGSRNLTIEYLAAESGFNTTSAFYTAFKKETGLTPTAYLASVQPVKAESKPSQKLSMG